MTAQSAGLQSPGVAHASPAAALRRLGVFGGAFDPPHEAHRAIAKAAIAQLQLDALWVFPTGQAWHKTRVLSEARHRIAMAELAFADLPAARVDLRETLRCGPSYTVDTLRELHTELPQTQLYLVMGQDQARDLSNWREWQAVVGLAIICVAARGDSTGTDTAPMPPAGLERRFSTLHLPSFSISATDIRARVRAAEPVAPLVGDAVARYIVHHHLYQADR